MVKSNIPEPMFKFSTRLFVWKKRVKKNGNCSLYLSVYITSNGKGEREYFPLKIDWPIQKIDFDNAILKPRSKDDLDTNDYNMIIMTERAKLNDIAKKYRLSGRVLTVAELKRELIFIENSKTVYQYILFKRNELARLKMISHQTWKHYGSMAERVHQFSPDVKFEQIDKRWMDRFKAYLKANKLAHNTIWGRIKELKALLRHASNEVGIYVDPSVFEYHNKAIETPIVYLNRKEVQSLIDLWENKKTNIRSLTEIEKQVLPAFLFSCFTSLRISDVYAAETTWMLSESFLTFTMRKNIERRPKTIRIPIAPIAKEFITGTLGNKFFKLPTQQEYNRTLKDIAELAGIKKKLTSHVGRHTFGYLFMTSVGDIFALKEIMGHSKIETTQRYAHLDEDSKLEMVMKMQSSFII